LGRAAARAIVYHDAHLCVTESDANNVATAVTLLVLQHCSGSECRRGN
jgi:hypothetical protein